MSDVIDNKETEQTVVFQEEVKSEVVSSSGLASAWVDSSKDQEIHSIKDVLGRPFHLSTHTWIQANAPGYTIFRNWPGQTTLADAYNCVWKMYGFTLFKGTFVVRVVANATPFHIGGLVVWSRPFFLTTANADRTTGPTWPDGLQRYPKAPEVTGYRHVKMDLCTAKAVELETPCVFERGVMRLASRNDPFDISNWENEFADISVEVLAPLKGTDGVDVTVYGFWKDVELYMPSHMPNSVSRHVVPQADTEEEKAKGSVTRALSTALGVIKQPIVRTILGGYQKPLSWVTKTVHDVAARNGWDIPVNVSPVSGYMNVPGRSLSHMHGTDNSHVLATRQDASIAPRPGLYGTPDDEMNIARFCSRPAIINWFTWSRDETQLTELARLPINPGFYSTFSAHDESYSHTTPLSYTASMFDLWRGDIAYKFHIYKNNFYSGRLAIVFVPNTEVQTLTMESMQTLKHVIWDVKETCEIEVITPFFSERQWLRTDVDSPVYNEPGQSLTYVMMEGRNLEDFRCGYLSVVVLNSLVSSNDTMPSSLDVSVEQHGINMEFAYPRCKIKHLIRADHPTPETYASYSLYSEQYTPVAEVVPQMLEGEAPRIRHVMYSSSGMDPLAPEGCVSESIHSFKELLARFALISVHGRNSAEGNFLPQPPYSTPNYGLHTVLTRRFVNCAQNFIMRGFWYYSGSKRYKIFCAPGNAKFVIVRTMLADGTDVSNINHGNDYMVQDVTLNPVVEFQIPYRRLAPMAPLWQEVLNPTAKLSQYWRVTPYDGSWRRITQMNGIVFEACGDDFTLGFQVGTPPVKFFTAGADNGVQVRTSVYPAWVESP